MIYYRKDKKNIVTLTLDMKGRSVNIINHKIAKVLLPVWEQLKKEEANNQLAGVVITSAKTSFLAGGDLDYLHQMGDAPSVMRHIEDLQQIMRYIETMRVPVVAAINGSAMGSGFELALACHYRLAYDSPRTLLGLPEVNLGIIPMGGSITRLNWLLGIEEAFKILTLGRPFHVREAIQRGLIDESVDDKEDLIARAREWILSKPKTTKPWDKEGAVIPARSNPIYRSTANTIARLNAQLLAKTLGNYPAIQAVLNVLAEGAVVEFDTARQMSSRYFTSLILSKECQNLTKARWYDHNAIMNGISRPKGYGRFRAKEVGIVGAGSMGSGIAYLCAMAGIKVYLKDLSVSIAEQGKNFSYQKLYKIVKSGKMTQAQMDEILDRIIPIDDASKFESCDLVIEAVFENAGLKNRITRETEMYMHKDAFLASNTSSLSITNLSEACVHPQNYVGLHFFSPVRTRPLVEIIVGKRTSDETYTRAFDFCKQIGKVPIVVQDHLGAFVYRVVRTYVLEGIKLLLEGQIPAAIEHAALQAGMEEPPLLLADRYSLNFLLMFEEKYIAEEGDQYAYPEVYKALKWMVKEEKRTGKARNKGWYTYNDSCHPRLWSALSEYFPRAEHPLSQKELMERLVFCQCIEAARCIEDDVIGTHTEANIASIYGWGFIPFKGGVIQYMNDYGVRDFVIHAKVLESRFGSRFKVPQLLIEMCEKDLNYA